MRPAGRPDGRVRGLARCGGGSRRFFVFDFMFFVNALNGVGYGEPDVRPAGRPDGRVRGLTRRGGGIRCGLLRVG